MLSFLENLEVVINCFCFKKKNDEPSDKNNPLDRRIYDVSRENKISILPIAANYDIENLYPLTDRVHLWNTFVVGNDKTYILANICDSAMAPNETLNAANLLNHRSNGIIPNDLSQFLDAVWDRTLNGRQLQFFMVWNSRLYFTNTFPFFNGKNKVIGAVMFMRAFETMPEAKFATYDNGIVVPMRRSEETERPVVPNPKKI